MKLEEIGFYTLSDARAKNSWIDTPVQRLEIIITDKCNFNCIYCRGIREDCKGTKSFEEVANIIDMCSGTTGIKNIRFSGGEPTLNKDLPHMVTYAKYQKCNHIAISTNGFSDLELYKKLISLGVNDFSISLDACCSADAKMMCGGANVFDKVVNNIIELSKLTYVTLGMVFTPENVNSAYDSVMFADSLGVADIRVISSAQYNEAITGIEKIPMDVRKKYPILNYRLTNFEKGENVRGIKFPEDTPDCGLVLDDIAVAGNKHFPCIIYLREQGEAIGDINNSIREDRLKWFCNNITWKNPICSKNCLDVCVAFNNKWNIFHTN